jgi:signal transduction histidine kinase/CheY-like chemotaxis protein
MSAVPTESAVRVVVIDDTADLRELLGFALARGGMDVVGEAGDGLAGIEQVRLHLPDVVLLDLSMPVMDGMTALPRIREIVPDARIIVFSGFGATQLTDRALAIGADDYLQKGTSLAKILERVREVLARPRRERAAPGADVGPAPHIEVPDPMDALTLAPYGVLQVAAEGPHPLLLANQAARDLLGHELEAGTPLARVASELVGIATGPLLRGDGAFEVKIGGRSCRVSARVAGGTVLLYLQTCSDEVAALRTAIAATAHEIRGPVAVLAALAETISEAAEEHNLDDDHLLGMTSSIARQARLLDSITADLLTTAQAQRGALKVTLETIDPRVVIDGAVRGRDVDLATVEVEDPRPVLADPLRLEQMLTNLLGNAHKHGRAPVFVRVRASREGEDLLCIDIEDSGDGVPEDFRDQLFEEFSRSEETTAPGTGLGLHVVGTLARAQGGSVTYAPAPGRGAVFTLTLPAAPA